MSIKLILPSQIEARLRKLRREQLMLFAAEDYAQRGFAVLPLHHFRGGVCTCHKRAECSSPGKHPLLSGGVKAATRSLAEVQRLWAEHPEANIGIATGAASSIIALDVDPRNGGADSLRNLKAELGLPPRTMLSDTGGGGAHFIFRYPPQGCRTRHAEAGLDLQADGAFIVAPPSLHFSGKLYRWRPRRGPDELPAASIPPAWLDRLQGAPSRQAAVASEARGGIVAEGQRNSHLTSLAGRLQRSNISSESLLTALLAENRQFCDPPLPDDEVARIAGSVSRYPAFPQTGDEADAIMQMVLDRHYAGGEHLMHLSDGRFWAYDGTRWAPLNQDTIRRKIYETIQGQARSRQTVTALLGQATTLLRARVAAEGDPLRFNGDPPPVINCRNGELWLNRDGSADLRPHRASSFLRYRIEIEYDHSATSPIYDQTVSAIFDKARDPASLIQFWHQLMGYAMQADRPTPLVVLGWGKGGNGKTKLLETLVRLLGRELVVSMPIGDLEKSRFSTGNLLGKLALIDDDVKAGTRLPDGQLKRLSEAKTVTGENKFGPSFTFECRTVVFMLFNNPPSLADLSYGMQRRLVVIRFDRSFTDTEADPKRFERIWTGEMAGVFNRYLAGLREVIANGWQLKRPKDVVAATDDLMAAANPLPAFVEEACEREGSELVDTLYRAYKQWADSAGITMMPQRLAFRRNLEAIGFKVVHANQGNKVTSLRLRTKG